MRDIRFRAWDKAEKEMTDVMELGFGEGVDQINWEESFRYELMQYTGLKDKNGKEIYKGDIVRSSNGKNIYQLVWVQACARWGLKREAVFPLSIHKATDGITKLELIGNIYENKELLDESLQNV